MDDDDSGSIEIEELKKAYEYLNLVKYENLVPNRSMTADFLEKTNSVKKTAEDKREEFKLTKT